MTVDSYLTLPAFNARGGTGAHYPPNRTVCIRETHLVLSLTAVVLCPHRVAGKFVIDESVYPIRSECDQPQPGDTFIDMTCDAHHEPCAAIVADDIKECRLGECPDHQFFVPSCITTQCRLLSHCVESINSQDLASPTCSRPADAAARASSTAS